MTSDEYYESIYEDMLSNGEDETKRLMKIEEMELKSCKWILYGAVECKELEKEKLTSLESEIELNKFYGNYKLIECLLEIITDEKQTQTNKRILNSVGLMLEDFFEFNTAFLENKFEDLKKEEKVEFLKFIIEKIFIEERFNFVKFKTIDGSHKFIDGSKGLYDDGKKVLDDFLTSERVTEITDGFKKRGGRIIDSITKIVTEVKESLPEREEENKLEQEEEIEEENNNTEEIEEMGTKINFLYSEKETVIPKKKETTIYTESTFVVPLEIYIYNGLAVTELEGYKIEVPNGITEEKAWLFNGEDKEHCGVFTLVKNNERKAKNSYFLTSKEGIVNPKKENTIYYLMVEDKTEGRIKKRVESFKFKEPIETTTKLCIDFGTTNTSIGCYIKKNYIEEMDEKHPLVDRGCIKLNETNYVNFFDIKEKKWAQTTPTTLYTTEIKDNKVPEFIFGYEANNRIEKENFYPAGTVVKNFKEWLKDIDNGIDLNDPEGKLSQSYPKKKIVEKYLKQLLFAAESQFKCRFKNLHFSAPVKRKRVYLDVFKDVLKDKGYEIYPIKDIKSLDEGVAGLYNMISDDMKNMGNKDNNKKKILVIDIGGGTTDLASCEFSYKKTAKGRRELDVYIDRVDGVDFGGNNITERIMKYMQIHFAKKCDSKVEPNIDVLMGGDADIFNKISKDKGTDDIYKRLNEELAKVENILSIDYDKYKNTDPNRYKRAKQNYFFLWERAEFVKKSFFKSNKLIQITFKEDEINTGEKSVGDKINIFVKKLTLQFEGNKSFEKLNTTLNIREIERLISPDIYNVIRRIITPLKMNLDRYNRIEELLPDDDKQKELLAFIKPLKNDGLKEYDKIKFVGQSCKIPLFKQFMKEFIAGDKIRSSTKNSKIEGVEELKLSCLTGAIEYLKDLGSVKLNIKFDNIAIPFKILTLSNDFEKPQEIIKENSRFESSIAYSDILDTGEDIHFRFEDVQNEVTSKTISTEENFEIKKWEENLYSYKEVREIDERINQKDHLDTLDKDEIRFFFLPMKKTDGLKVFAIKKENEENNWKFKKSNEKLFKFDDIRKKLKR